MAEKKKREPRKSEKIERPKPAPKAPAPPTQRTPWWAKTGVVEPEWKSAVDARLELLRKRRAARTAQISEIEARQENERKED